MFQCTETKVCRKEKERNTERDSSRYDIHRSRISVLGKSRVRWVYIIYGDVPYRSHISNLLRIENSSLQWRRRKRVQAGWQNPVMAVHGTLV